MKTLFLCSSFADVKDLFGKFNQGQHAGKRVTFIPTASRVEDVTFYVETGKEALESFGLVIDELDIATATSEDIINKLQNNDYIYVTGGNTFFLLQELKRTNAAQIIIDQVQSGKTYIGESAGSIVLAPNIEYVAAMDNPAAAPALSVFTSLELVDFYLVPHCSNVPFKESAERTVANYANTLNLLSISNSQAVVVQGDQYEVWNSYT